MNAPEMLQPTLPPQQVSLDVLAEKYAKHNEQTPDDVRRRVAAALSAHESPERRADNAAQFMWAQQNGFVPAGRIASAAGMDLKATLINCFVQPVGDSVDDTDANGLPGIYQALAQAARTMCAGGGVGYDFSPIRPSGSKVRSTMTRASGPLSYLKVFNESARTIESAGARRGAQMGVLRIDHPDIEAFIAAKDNGDFSGFNLSVGVTDEFMDAVQNDQHFNLVHTAEPSNDQIADGAYQHHDSMWVYRKIRARDLWDKVIRSTYDHAEPGVLFLDRINAENNLYYCERLAATNPCGEQPLPSYGCCDLGSINLTHFVKSAFTDDAWFDFDTMMKVVNISVRMLDQVLDATVWPLAQQQAEAQGKRRIGLGFLGLGDALVMLGIPYNTKEACSIAAKIARQLRDAAYWASVELAKEKGPFPLFDPEKYLAGQFIQRLPGELRDAIRTHGIRNSHLLSIAPTGTITLAFADNASNGIEPAYAWTYQRKKRMPDDTTKTYEVEDHAYRRYLDTGRSRFDLPPEFVTALEMSAQDHLNMMAAVQPFIDTAISKTVNIPVDYPFDDFRDLYTRAWQGGLKGLATYRPNAVTGSVLSVGEQAQPALQDDDPLHKRVDKRPLGELNSVTSKIEYFTHEGRETMYLGVTFMPIEGVVNGRHVTIERPFEFFIPAAQRRSQQWSTTLMRTLSLIARDGGPVAKALADWREAVWEKGPVRCGQMPRHSDGVLVPVFHDSVVAAIAYMFQQILIKRGFLDAQGNQVPVHQLVARHGPIPTITTAATTPASLATAQEGAKCPDCKARALQRVDGCQRCQNCHYIGSCG